MSTKVLSRFTEQVSDLDKEVSELYDFMCDLESIWADMSYEKGPGIFHEDFQIRSWEEDLEEAVYLETVLIPKQLELVRKLMGNANQSFVNDIRTLDIR
jgi:hypothetical protein